MDKQAVPKTMLEAVRQFADPQRAHDFFVAMRWPNGVACPFNCGSVLVAYMPKRRRWYCNDCKRQFTAKVGTIFEDSPIGFDKWLPAFWLLASNRNGISSC
jgi:transposase-like protein